MNVAIEIDFAKPWQKYVRVSYDIRFERDDPEEFTLVMPSWTPGSYLIRDFATHVEGFSALDPKGRELRWTKTAKSRWKIDRAGGSRVLTTHRIYANDLSVRGAYADHEMAFINAPAAFLHPEGRLADAVRLKIKPPKGWGVATAKNAGRDGWRVFESFDEFYDTPILTAEKLEIRTFKAGKTAFRLAAAGPHRTDLTRVCRDLKKIAAAQTQIFGAHPCREYLFQVLFAKGGYGGLEHADSSTNIFDGFSLDDPKRYPIFLTLLAHEHFHLWNVKRIRPVALGPFDYDRENYTRELWLAEGLTSYYDDHTAYRAGVYSVPQYLDVLAENIDKLQAQKGARVASLSAASFDAWVKHYKPNENTHNVTVSYYLKGGLVMMLLDFEIIKASGGRHTLDGVMAALYELYRLRPGIGITKEEFFACAEGFAGRSLGHFVADHVDGTAAIDWEGAFHPFGIAVASRAEGKSFEAGFSLKESGGRVTIDKIDEDGPAFLSELQSGDEILAVGGERADSVKSARQALRGPKTEVLFARRGLVYRTELSPILRANPVRKLVASTRLTPSQKKYLKVFLRR
jgi:predicted metalloprotease with PDZ domain